MFEKTSTPNAPWHAIPANSKWFARLHVLDIITKTLKAGVDISPPPIDGNVARIAAEMLGVETSA